MTRRRSRLEVTPLEDRVTPVLGAFDTPFVTDPDDNIANSTADFSGVVLYGDGGTGFLLDRGPLVVGSRHIVTAAHVAPQVGDIVTFYRRLPDGNLDIVQIPVISVWNHPTWTGNVSDNLGDVSVATLASAAPNGVMDYLIYTPTQAAAASEVGQVYYMGGYGLSGTGFSAQSNVQELQRMTITATGGRYRIIIPAKAAVPSTGQPAQPQITTGLIEWNATAAQIQSALVAVGAPAQVTLINLGPQAPAGATRSYEILFNVGSAGMLNRPRLTFDSPRTGPQADPLVNGGNDGTVVFTTMLNGGTDPEYQRITVAAAGGRFRLGFSGVVTNPITFDPADLPGTAARIQTALQALNVPGPGPGEVTVRVVNSGQDAGSFEVSFDDIGFDIPLLTVDATELAGTAKASTAIDGGRRGLRIGSNINTRIIQGVLENDFQPARPDQFEGQGDSGSAGFVVLPDKSVAAISVVSYATFPFSFGSVGFNTRLSKYSNDILAQAGTPGYPLTLDMQYQFAGNDGVPDTITVSQGVFGDANTPVIQVWVDANDGKGKKLYYQDAVSLIDSVRIIGTADNETFIVDPAITKLVTVDGGFGTDTIIGPTAATAWVLTGAGIGTGDTAGTDFDFRGIENVVGNAGNDTFTFAATGSLAGTLDGGGGADSINLSAQSSSSVVLLSPSASGYSGTGGPIARGFNNIDGFTGNPFNTTDSLVTPGIPGVFTHTGVGGVYVSASGNQPFTYANLDILIGGAADDTFNVRSLTGALTIDGGSGNDTVNVAADAPTNGTDRGTVSASLVVRGGAGVDSFRFNGTAANEAVTARVVGPNTGDVQGMTPAGVTVAFDTLEQFLFDGRGGTNSFTALDISGTSLGTPTDPGSGVVYAPTGPTGGGARINGVTVGAIAVGGFTVNGDPDNSGDDDVLTVVGTSAAGLQSAFGEAVVGDGRDRITVTESQVTFQSVQGGSLLPVQIGYTNGFQTFSTLYVAGGNERGNEGDTFDLPTTLTFNLVADGMLPASSIRPGDRLILSAPGGADSQLVTDPSLGPTQVRVTARADGSSAGVLGFESGVPAVPGAGMVAVGSDAGFPSTVRVFDRITGAFRYEVTPFPGFNDGVKVASGDVNGDGIADLVVGAGPNGGPRVGVFDGLSGAQLYDFFGYEESFRGGVTVAVGDVDLDGFGDLILGTGPGGGARVRVLSGRDLTPLRDAVVYEQTFRGGVSVAAGDVNGDGVPDLITSAGFGGGPRVVVVDGRTTAQLASFFVFDPSSRAGFFAAGGDVNGDGFADVIAGSGATAPAQIRIFSGFNRAVLNDFYINDPFNPGLRTSGIGTGVRVATADADGDGVADVITGLGPGGDAVVRTYKVTGVNPQTNALFPTLAEIRRQDAFDFGYNFGVFVGASD